MALAVPVLALAGCGGSSAAGGGSGQSAAPAEISVGYFGDWESTFVVAVGSEEGFFDAAGLDVTPQQFGSGPPEVAALQSGSLDFAMIGPGPIGLAMGGQATILGINDLSITDHLIAKKSITSAADLKGKSVILAKGTVEEVILALALKEAGLTMDDVKQVNIPDFATQVSAYLSGQADAIAASAPFATTILSKDPDSAIIYSDGTIYPKMVMPDSWATSASYLSANEDIVTRFMWAVAKVQDWSIANLDKSIADVAKFTKQSVDVVSQNAPPDHAKLIPPADLAKAYSDGTAENWYHSIGDVFVETGRIESVPASDTYLDFGPAVEAAKKLDQSTY